MLVTSSTTHSKWYCCPYSHWLYSKLNGTGIVPVAGSWHTLFGSKLHDGVEGGLLGKPFDAAYTALAEADYGSELTIDGLSRSQELKWLGYGILRAAYDWAIPLFLSIYDIEHIEQEYVIPLPLHSSLEDCKVRWLTKPDVVPIRRGDKQAFNCNIKSTGWIKDLGKQYEFSPQMLMEAKAIKLSRGIDTGGTIIFALSKGHKGVPTARDKELKREGYRMESPFTYVWWKKDKKSGRETYSFTGSKGAEKIGVWEFNKTPEEWYSKIPEEMIKAQVEFSMPIVHHPVDLDRLAQDIITVEEMADKGIAPCNLNACNSYGTYNKECDYKLWCHGTEQERSTLFIPRTPHHPHETMLQNAELCSEQVEEEL